MDELAAKVKVLKRGPVATTIDGRREEFKSFQNAPSKDLYKEMCFCILTANCSAEMCLRVHSEIGDRFCTINDEESMSKLLKDNKYRFYNVRAKYLCQNIRMRDILKEELDSLDDDITRREYLVKHVKGLGYKEASHFLRNVGYFNVAIIDFHIVDALVDHGILPERPKTMNKKKYFELEEILRDLAASVGLDLGTLDLYLWYMETGKVLK